MTREAAVQERSARPLALRRNRTGLLPSPAARDYRPVARSSRRRQRAAGSASAHQERFEPHPANVKGGFALLTAVPLTSLTATLAPPAKSECIKTCVKESARCEGNEALATFTRNDVFRDIRSGGRRTSR